MEDSGQVGIINLAMIRIGADIISAIDENTPNAIKANAVWTYLFNEVIQARDWKFAKTRIALAKRSLRDAPCR